MDPVVPDKLPRNECGVKGCSSKKSDPERTFFVIPKYARKNLKLYKQWITSLEWSMVEIRQNLKICDKHFDDKSFFLNINGHKRLLENAYPNSNLPGIVNIPREFFGRPKIRPIELNIALTNHRKCTEMANKVEIIHPLDNITNSGNKPKLKKVTVKPEPTTNCNAPRKKLPIPKKFEDLTKSKLVLKDGKVLTPIKLKRKARKKEPTPPKKNRSIIMLENGVVVFKNNRLESSNSFSNSIFTPDSSINSIFTPDASINTTVSSEYLTEDNQIEERSISQPNEESPKFLYKDGKILKQVKFKRKKIKRNDSIRLPSPLNNQSSHLVQPLQEFPSSSDSIFFTEEFIPADGSIQIEEAPPADTSTSIGFAPPEHYAEYEGPDIQEFEMYENSMELETIKLENGVKIEFQALDQVAKRGRPRKEDNTILTTCSVPGCGTQKNLDSSDTDSFIFLTNKGRKFRVWAEAIKLKLPYPQMLKICFNHFKKSDILINHLGKRRIHQFAIPTLNLPVEKPKSIVTKTGLVLKPVKFKKPSKVKR